VKKTAVKHAGYVADSGLCVGCGLCASVCPAEAVEMRLEWDSYKPTVDAAQCLAGAGCRRCLKVCPGIGFDFASNAGRLWGNVPEETGLGHYSGLYTGYSSDDAMRYDCASGGMVTGLLVHLLEKGEISGAAVVGSDPDQPYLARATVARTRDEILGARGSRYCPVSYHGIREAILSAEGKHVIVGLPCHIQGFRLLSEVDARFASKIYGYFGLFCSSTRTRQMPEYLCYKYGMDLSKIDGFSYRGGGNPGYLQAVSKEGQVLCRVPYHEYYRKLRAFFNNRRCMLCFDHTAEFADVSFGDIHIEPFLRDEKGANAVIVRNVRFAAVLRGAQVAGAVALHPLTKEELLSALRRGIHTKKHRIGGAFFLRRLAGRTVPDSGRGDTGRARPRDVVSAASGLVQSWIGRRRIFWRGIDGMAQAMARIKGV